MRPGSRIIAALALLSVLGGCGGKEDDSGGSSGSNLSHETALSYEGIYQLTSFTSNDSGCDAEGADAMNQANEKLFVMLALDEYGVQTVQLVSCVDTADCQAKVTEIRNMGSWSADYALTLSSEVSADELGGFMASTGYQDQESQMCTERDYEDYALTRSGDSVRLEIRKKALPDRPAEDGFCMVYPAKSAKEAESAPCIEYQVLVASKTAAL